MLPSSPTEHREAGLLPSHSCSIHLWSLDQRTAPAESNHCRGGAASRAAIAPGAPPSLVAFSRCQAAPRWGQSSVFLPVRGRHGLALAQEKQIVALKAASPEAEPRGSSTRRWRANGKRSITLCFAPLAPLPSQSRDECPHE